MENEGKKRQGCDKPGGDTREERNGKEKETRGDERKGRQGEEEERRREISTPHNKGDSSRMMK